MKKFSDLHEELKEIDSNDLNAFDKAMLDVLPKKEDGSIDYDTLGSHLGDYIYAKISQNASCSLPEREKLLAAFVGLGEGLFHKVAPRDNPFLKVGVGILMNSQLTPAIISFLSGFKTGGNE